ncbi:hypothetical protein F5X99DRAFT_423639 [Biscogniauxia marginata]|nr:hypothetical protein F5X99DRAFT_423639 [Biscogniauxia marginata]
MPDQLPHGAEGAAAVTLIFASISWICSAVMIWLTWSHNQRLSCKYIQPHPLGVPPLKSDPIDVALLAYITIISTIASIIQQIHDIVRWRDVVTEQFQHRIENPDNADLQLANGSVGMDLVLFYIQFYCYNVEALLITFWASELVQSIYGLNERLATGKILERFNTAGKIVALVLPIIFILVVRAPAIQNSVQTLIHIVGIPLLISLGCGSLLMLAILFRYIQTRRQLVPFFPGSLQSSDPEGSKSRSNRIWGSSVLGSNGVYDRWLMTRFTISFVLLGVFQATSFLFQRYSAHNTEADLQSARPDLSPARARQTLYLFIPGNTPGVALFIVFGTTTAFRRHMYKTLVPRRWQKQQRRRRRRRRRQQQQQEIEGGPPTQDSTAVVERIWMGDRDTQPSFMRESRVTATAAGITEAVVGASDASLNTGAGTSESQQKNLGTMKSSWRTPDFAGKIIETSIGSPSSELSAPIPTMEQSADLEMTLSRDEWAVASPEATEPVVMTPVPGHYYGYAHEHNGTGDESGPGSHHGSDGVPDDRDPAFILIYEPSTGLWRTGNSI